MKQLIEVHQTIPHSAFSKLNRASAAILLLIASMLVTAAPLSTPETSPSETGIESASEPTTTAESAEVLTNDQAESDQGPLLQY